MGKTLRPDDLKPGIFVALTGTISNDETDEYVEKDHFTFQKMQQRRHDRYGQYNGLPLEVLAVDFPFICVNNGVQTFGMDIRGLILTKLSTRFVEEMRAGMSIDGKQRYSGERRLSARERREKSKERKRQIKAAKKDKRICPRCFNVKTKQVLKQGIWYYACDVCGLERPIDDNGNGSPVTE